MEQSWWRRDAQLRCKEFVLVAMATAVVSLTLSSAGYVTNEWTVVSVDRVKLKTLAIEARDVVYLITLHSDYNYFDRKRGLFQTCFPDNNETEFLKDEEFYKSGKCLHEPAIKFKETNSSWGSDYRRRNDLVRAHVILFGLGIAFLFLAFASGLATCAVLNTGVLLGSAVCSILSFFTSLAGMIIFHIYDDIEIHDLAYKPFYYYWSSKDSVLRENSSVKYGFSLFLAWAGTGLCLITTVLFWAAYFTLKGHNKGTRPISNSDRKYYDGIDNYTYYGIKRPPEIRHWKDIKISPHDNIRNYYLHSREPSFSGSNGRLFPLSSRRLNPGYSPYDYYDYHNVYGSSGVYPY